MNEEIDPNLQPTAEQQVLPFDPPLEQRPPPAETETDALRAQCAELQLRLKQIEARDELTAALRSAGARSPELVFAAAKDALQFGDDGSVQNTEAVVTEMRRKYPDQFGPQVAPAIDAGAGRDASPNALTKDALAKMKPDEIAALD